jgi:hypothetical protein
MKAWKFISREVLITHLSVTAKLPSSGLLMLIGLNISYKLKMVGSSN